MNNLPVPQLQAIAIALGVWAWFFVLIPARAFAVGLRLQSPPVFFRMASWKLIRIGALLLFAALGWFLAPPTSMADLDFGGALSGVIEGVYLGPVLGVLLVVILLFIIPLMVAGKRLKNEEEPGEWMTVTLTFYRWAVLGLVLLGAVGLIQIVPPFGDMLDFPLSEFAGLVLPLAFTLFYILWWGLPSSRVNRLAEEENNPVAIDSLESVRLWGLPAYLNFELKRSGRGRRAGRDSAEHKLCPSCMRAVDRIELYDSLEFENCPHCHEIIPPVFTIREYVDHYAERAAELASGVTDKKGSKVKEVERHEQDIMQRILRATLTMGMRERGTDLHLITENDRFIVRCRTDGILFNMLDMPSILQRPMISIVKVQSNLDISERRRPQDGSFKTSIDGKKLDVRVNTSPTAETETASLRLLYEQRVLGSLERLGMTQRSLRQVNEVIMRPHGLVLVTGPTGSGKSTTLYNALGTIADGKRNIITLEDPIEFKIEGLTQMQVNHAKGFEFASGLRSILRQDPDVIMVGEIRDSETAKMAIDAAMTGHLVFSTLHTIDTTTTIGRLWDLGVDPHRHSEAILLLVAQRLVRLNCRHCLVEYEMHREQLEAIGLDGAPEKLVLRRGEGCDFCHQSGYYEREGIYELLEPNDSIRQMIASRTPPAEIRRLSRSRGMRTLLEDGMVKVVLGRTTVDEVMRVTN